MIFRIDLYIIITEIAGVRDRCFIAASEVNGDGHDLGFQEAVEFFFVERHGLEVFEHRHVAEPDGHFFAGESCARIAYCAGDPYTPHQERNQHEKDRTGKAKCA